MKRKLISFDAFKKIEEGSLTKAQEELIGAEEVLANSLEKDSLNLFVYGESDVTYQEPDGNFVHATYSLNKDQLVLENIEQLVIEESGEKKSARQVLVNMVDSLLENNEAKASNLFESYLSMPFVRRELLVNEATKPKAEKLASKKSKKNLKNLKNLKKFVKKGKNPKTAFYAKKIKPETIKEWQVMCENVINYINYKEFGPVLSESFIRTDNKGNVVAVAVPTLQKRNESKILSFNWKTLDHELKVLRGKMKRLSEDQAFVKAMSDLKRYNNISDNISLEETLEAIVSRWPDVLYSTEEELSSQIATALETANVSNYDDKVCSFMAEAILRTAHNAYTDRVRKIGNLAGATTDVTAECKQCEDSYKEFKTLVDGFYAKLDESDQANFKMFSDLFNALNEVRKVAVKNGDEATQSETENFMQECAAILNYETEIDLGLAESIASYIHSFVEANVDGANDTWDVNNNNVHHTVSGDHPRMSWAAKVGDAVPSKFPGDWGDSAPVSDGKSYKNNLADEMRSNAWGNHSDGDEWPALSNPYVPKPFGDYKMKEKSAVDDGDSDWSRWQSGDTWPNLKNPYVPASPWDKTKGETKA
jgi:hypothetical protein